MRYYVVKIYYNKVAGAEDRPQPAGFDDISAAKKAFHSFMTQSILAETCGWCLCMIINEYGKVEMQERWESDTPELSTEVTEE